MLPALLAVTVPTFGLLGIGWLWRHLDPRSDGAVHALSRYAFVVALPALIFTSVFRLHGTGPGLARADAMYLLALVAGHIAVGIIAFTLRPLSRRTDVRALAPTLLMFGSTAYFGIPYATYAFGAEGTGLAAIGAVALVIVALAVGLGTLTLHASRKQRTASWHQLFELPFLWVVLLALGLPTVGVAMLPVPLMNALDAVAASAAPVALIALGAFARDLSLTRVPWRWAVPLGIGKVLLPAGASYIALSLLGISGVPLAVGTALGATPLAITAFTLAEEYGVGRELVTGTMAVSLITTLFALTAITALWLGTGVFG
ncbi:MAG: hypothetical protein Q7T01_02470 [bacterium]|nr:hypothetical protein [bacterium]